MGGKKLLYIIIIFFSKLFCFNSMSAAIDFSKYVKGEPVKVVVRVSREKIIKR